MVEVLISSGIVSVLAVSGLASFNYMRNAKNRSTQICRAHVSGVVEKFRSIGHFAAIDNFVPVGSTRKYSGSTPYSLSSKGIPDSLLWPNSLDVLSDSGSPTLGNSVLIASSINALLAIYNSNASFCSTGAVYTGTGDLITRASTELPGANLTVRIQPYNINTGALLGCPMPLRIAPDAMAGTPPATATNPPKAESGNTRYQAGLLLTVNQTYTDEDGQSASCSISQRFQYSGDSTPPPDPDFRSITRTNANPTWTSNCVSAYNEFVITVGYSAVDMEPGSVLVCRDTSVLKEAGSPNANWDLVSCGGPGAPANKVMAYSLGSNYRPASGNTGLNFFTGHSAKVSDTGNLWVPCEKVTACGMNPYTAVLDPTSTPTRPRFILTYRDLPGLCRINIEVAAIDTASNSSRNLHTSSQAATPTVYEGAPAITNWDVPMPLCGSTCGSCGTNCGVNLSTVYFRCGGCP